jgi:hypothetical protein
MDGEYGVLVKKAWKSVITSWDVFPHRHFPEWFGGTILDHHTNSACGLAVV